MTYANDAEDEMTAHSFYVVHRDKDPEQWGKFAPYVGKYRDQPFLLIVNWERGSVVIPIPEKLAVDEDSVRMKADQIAEECNRNNADPCNHAARRQYIPMFGDNRCGNCGAWFNQYPEGNRTNPCYVDDLVGATEFLILRSGWEMDNTGWIAEDGRIYTTSHGGTKLYPVSLTDLREHIAKTSECLDGHTQSKGGAGKGAT